MCSKREHDQDLQILAAISGIEDPESCGIQIESNYFVREARENMAEQGEIELDDDSRGRSDKEKALFINEGNHSRLHNDRRGNATLSLDLSEFEKQRIPTMWLYNMEALGHDVEEQDPDEVEERRPLSYRRVVR
jgi:hypothetical protein